MMKLIDFMQATAYLMSNYNMFIRVTDNLNSLDFTSTNMSDVKKHLKHLRDELNFDKTIKSPQTLNKIENLLNKNSKKGAYYINKKGFLCLYNFSDYISTYSKYTEFDLPKKSI